MDTIPSPLTPQLTDEQLHMHGLLEQLTAFPHIANRIELMWGTADGRKYLFSLTIDYDDNKAPRKGFPFAVLDAILSLLQLHDERYPHLGTVVKSWEQSTFK